jgi:hypothetical protein
MFGFAYDRHERPRRELIKKYKPCSIQPGKSGNMEVIKKVVPKHDKLGVFGIEKAVLPWRTASTTYDYRMQPADGQTEVVATILREIHEDGQAPTVWMSDTPFERHTNKPCAGIKGRVLVGGLGLGLFLQDLHDMKRRKITEVVVVDTSQDVIDIVGPQIEKAFRFPVQIVHGDIHTVGSCLGDFDSCYLDIWEALSDDYGPCLPTVEAIQLNVKGRIQLWGEKILGWNPDKKVKQHA